MVTAPLCLPSGCPSQPHPGTQDSPVFRAESMSFSTIEFLSSKTSPLFRQCLWTWALKIVVYSAKNTPAQFFLGEGLQMLQLLVKLRNEVSISIRDFPRGPLVEIFWTFVGNNLSVPGGRSLVSLLLLPLGQYFHLQCSYLSWALTFSHFVKTQCISYLVIDR